MAEEAEGGCQLLVVVEVEEEGRWKLAKAALLVHSLAVKVVEQVPKLEVEEAAQERLWVAKEVVQVLKLVAEVVEPVLRLEEEEAALERS